MQEQTETCPECKGKKVVDGVCICDREWLGTQVGDVWDDCRCAKEEECSLCNGRGYIKRVL